MDEQKKEIRIDDLRVLHPSFFNYLRFLIFPLALMFFIPLGVDVFYVLLAVWVFEILLVLGCWLVLATTAYIIKSDRIEISSGVLIKQSQTIPYDKIINITCDQSVFQRLLNIGNVFIDTAGGKPFETALLGVENHKEIADFLFTLKKGGTE
jgi:putative membrane protein